MRKGIATSILVLLLVLSVGIGYYAFDEIGSSNKETITTTTTTIRSIITTTTSTTTTSSTTTTLLYDDESISELAAIEREIDILIDGNNNIGFDHLSRLADRLDLIDGKVAKDDWDRVNEKLVLLETYTSNLPSDWDRGVTTTTTTLPEDHVAAVPDPEYDNIVWTLPSTASPLRLSLPADIDDFLFDEHGSIGGYGLHSGGHVEGLTHSWIELKPGTPVRSWADGEVIEVSRQGADKQGEYFIYIDYGYNLRGIHMEVAEPYVEVGDTVTQGQEIGIGESFSPTQSSAEMGLVDFGRSDGIEAWGGGSHVSIFDYLNDDDKNALVDRYKKEVLDRYAEDGTKAWMFAPYQPYLTNEVLLHPGNDGKLSGVWYLTSSDWEDGAPTEIMTFIEADNPYYKGNVVKGIDDTSLQVVEYMMGGSFDVDYDKGQLYNNNGYRKFYCIFEIDESKDRARMKLECGRNGYPSVFTSAALEYAIRSRKSIYEDLNDLGVKYD